MPRMLDVIARNAAGPRATRRYPQERRAPFERARADLSVDMSRCKLCGTCARTCPSDALSVDRERRVWERDLFACLTCGDCVEACPKQALSFHRHPPPPASGRVRTAYRKPEEGDED